MIHLFSYQFGWNWTDFDSLAAGRYDCTTGMRCMGVETAKVELIECQPLNH